MQLPPAPAGPTLAMAAASGDCPSLYSLGCARTAPERRSTSNDVELVPSMQILVIWLRRSAGMAASRPKRALHGNQGHSYVSCQAFFPGIGARHAHVQPFRGPPAAVFSNARPMSAACLAPHQNSQQVPDWMSRSIWVVATHCCHASAEASEPW